eukprot:8858102-Ditylum_brightwellii.AAC.1
MRVFVIGASEIDTAKRVATKYAFLNSSGLNSISFSREEERVHTTVDGTEQLIFHRTFLPS